jgi:hypothetical protein
VINLELGTTVMIETYGNLVIVGLGQAIVLAMALPMIVLIAIVNFLYNKVARNLSILRSRYE